MRRILFIICIAIVVAGCTGSGDAGKQTAAVTVISSDQPLTLAVADDPEERRRGLMGYNTVPRDGMLFIYADAAPRTFWMKNTTIPLDIIFLDGNGTVLNVEHADPQPGASDSELERYRSDGPAHFVIELRQGDAARYGIQQGTRIQFTERIQIASDTG